MLHMLRSWPKAKIFPALDVIRCMALHTHDGLARVAHPAVWSLMLGASQPDAPINNQIIVTKYITNMLASPEGRAMLGGTSERLDEAIGHLAEYVETDNAKLKGDVAAALANIAAMTFQGCPAFGETHAMQCLAMQVELMAPAEDAEVVYRALVASGTMAKADAGNYKKFCAQDDDWVQRVTHHAAAGTGKVMDVAKGIEMLH